MSNATGIDVSDNNGEFDWAAWPHIDFAMAKAIEGPHDGGGMFYDPQFARNWAAMRDGYGNKLVRVAYCFLHPAASIADQAHALTDVVRKEGLQPGDHFMVDLEPYAGLATPDGLPAAEVAARTREFCHLINVLNPDHRCLVYVNPATAREGCCAGVEPWRLFVADWDVTAPEVPAPWRTWHFWQYRSGANGEPDLDAYNGDRAALLDFARMPAGRR